MTNLYLNRLPAVFAALLGALPAAHALDYYVAPTGSDSNNGTQSTPYKTIQKAITTATAGSNVYITAGTYREPIEVTAGTGGASGNPIVVQPAGANDIVIIKGSELVQANTGAWTLHSGAIWKKTQTLRPQQVFVNFSETNLSPSLNQVGNPNSAVYSAGSTYAEYPVVLPSLVENSFSWDSAGPTLYVWLPGGANPNSSNIEVSVRRRLFFTSKPYITLRNLRFRHSASSSFAEQEIAVQLNSGCRAENLDIQWCDFTGLSMGYAQVLPAVGAVAVNCNISNNGAMGVTAPGSKNFLIQACTMNNNNYRGFQRLWHAGGFKGAADAYGTIEDCEVGSNNGSGIWFDYADSGNLVTIRRNYIHNNGPTDAGIMFEGSKNGSIYNNLLIENERRGVYISASDDTRVYNNTIVRQKGRAPIDVDGMPRSGKTLKNNSIVNNIIYNNLTTNPQYDLLVRANSPGTDIEGNVCNYNLIHRASGALVLSTSGGTYNTIANWRTATGYDLQTVIGNPSFVVGAGEDWCISTTSVAANAGTNTVAGILTTDYAGVARAGTYDIGAFEATVAPLPTQNLYTTQTPSGSSSVGEELGTKFKSSVAGTVLGVRIYTTAAEASGTHQVRLWNTNGTLVSGPHAWPITGGTAGWKSFTLPAPVSILANTYYIVSVTASPGTSNRYARTAAGFNAPINSGNLRADIGAGVYSTTAGAMPTTTENNSSYFRDVIFQP